MRKPGPVPPRVTFSIRVPPEHVAAIEGYAKTLSDAMRVPVTTSSAAAAVVEAGLVALGLIEAPERLSAIGAALKGAAVTPEKGGKRAARKP